MKFRASYNASPTRKKLQARARGLGESLPELLRRAGRLVAVSLATSTQPYGTSGDARESGEHATASDIRRVYATPGDVMNAFTNQAQGKIFYALLQQGKIDRARELITKFCPKFAGIPIGPFVDGSDHRDLRNAHGHIPKNLRPALIVTNPPKLYAYIKSEIRNVGEAKGGWATCARELGGTRGLPQWVTRHAGRGESPGAVIENRDREHPAMTLRNGVEYADQVLSETDKEVAVRIGIDRLSAAIFNEELRLGRAHPIS